MSLQKMAIEGTMYDVMTWEEYWMNPSIYQYAAINIQNGFIYPVRRYDTMVEQRPGIYLTNTGMSLFIHPTTQTDIVAYSDANLIDFNKVDNMREYIRTRQRLANEERAILTTIDNVFIPEISEDDTPEMVAFKQAIMDKGIDIDKYEPRIGTNYNNDKRLLKKPSITFGKLRSLCQAFDIKATITFEDANANVPNPIGRTISAELTTDTMSVEEEDSK